MSGTAKLPVFIWTVGFPPHMMLDDQLRLNGLIEEMLPFVSPLAVAAHR